MTHAHGPTPGEPLPRRGLAGMRCVTANGVHVTAVVPHGPADCAGLVAGDVITHVQGRPVTAVEDLGRFHAGTVLTLRVVSGGLERAVTVTPAAQAMESYVHGTATHGSITHGATLRTVTVRPPGPGPFPCVMYLQGYDCVSVDRGGIPDDPLVACIDALCAAGVAVFRVEKEGVGDSTGGAPEDVSYATEQGHFLAALQALRVQPWVRTDRVFLLGHSLGAMHATVLGAQAPVAGVMLYGGGLRTWGEYLTDNLRRQMALARVDPVTVEDTVRAQQVLTAAMLVEGMPLPTVIDRHPALPTFRWLGITSDTHVSGRHHGYWQAVHDAATTAALRDLPVPCLAAWGASDWLSFRGEHQDMAAVVEQYHPGHGTFAEVPGSDHWFLAHATEALSYRARGQGVFNPAVSATLLGWMQRVGASTR